MVGEGPISDGIPAPVGEGGASERVIPPPPPASRKVRCSKTLNMRKVAL